MKDMGAMPVVGTSPNVGLRPMHPERAAGIRVLPPVSVPSAARASRATTATADPPEEPPGVRVTSHGFLLGPKCGLLVVMPKASSWVLVLPSRTAPASRRRAATVASQLGM